MVSDLGTLIAYIEKHPAIKTVGSLVICSRGKSVNIYRETAEGKREYLGKDKEALIRDLSKKTYYMKMLSAARKEKEQLEKCIRILSSGYGITDIDDVYPSLNKVIRRTEGPFSMTEDGYAMKWLKKNSYLKDRRQLSGQNKTLKGEYVKSKSEVIIADRLTYYGVPYVYEVTTAKDAFEEMGRPDFLILNKRTGKEYFWEHLGRMGDPQYAARNQVKMEQFARQGILPGKNLIVSFECGERPLSTEYVDSIIKESLI
ncbi:MAG: hypothetical protein K6E89_01575 [Sphaerochaetaceae bacterium]|nr:hypothetical protein [Sphaerochaetaceae bacterium]